MTGLWSGRTALLSASQHGRHGNNVRLRGDARRRPCVPRDHSSNICRYSCNNTSRRTRKTDTHSRRAPMARRNSRDRQRQDPAPPRQTEPAKRARIDPQRNCSREQPGQTMAKHNFFSQDDSRPAFPVVKWQSYCFPFASGPRAVVRMGTRARVHPPRFPPTRAKSCATSPVRNGFVMEP